MMQSTDEDDDDEPVVGFPACDVADMVKLAIGGDTDEDEIFSTKFLPEF